MSTMSTITITISDDRMRKLEGIAARYGLTPEELLRTSLEDILTRPDDAFQRAARYVIDKNAELYQRLA